jgi:3-oxoacyl-[acyl-carrier protein] reductase
MNDTPVAVVTGGAGGLGSAIGRALTSDGFQVVLAGRNREAAQRVADEIGESLGLRPHPGQVDVANRESVAALARDIGERYGRLDVLVNNAGTEPSNSLEDTTVADWDLTMDVNVKGAMLMCQAALPFWRAQGSGSIVNISSRTHLGCVRNPAYVSSKAAIVGLTREMAFELGPIGVRSNAVAPSFVLTPFNEQRRDLADMDAMIAKYVAFTPLRRLIEPDDVANAVAFLASERARNITGEVIHVCAGSQLPPAV